MMGVAHTSLLYATALGVLAGGLATASPASAVTYSASCTTNTYKPYNTIRMTVTVERNYSNGRYDYLLHHPRATSPNGWDVNVWVNGKKTSFTMASSAKLTAVAKRGTRVEGLSCTVWLSGGF